MKREGMVYGRPVVPYGEVELKVPKHVLMEEATALARDAHGPRAACLIREVASMLPPPGRDILLYQYMNPDSTPSGAGIALGMPKRFQLQAISAINELASKGPNHVLRGR